VRDAATGIVFLVMLTLWAFRTGQLWDEPDRLADFWILQGLAAVVATALWGLGRGACPVYGCLVLRFDKGQTLERARVVTYLRQQAEEHRRLSLGPGASVLRHDLEVGEITLAQAADDIEHRHHVPGGSQP
jgi:hypothetical protein